MYSIHRLLVFVSVFVLFWLLIVVPPMAAADTVPGQLVEAPAELVHELWNTRQAPHVVVPLNLEQGAVLADVAVTYVEADGKPDTWLLSAFRPSIVAGRVLQLEVDFEKVQTPKVYEIEVQLIGTLAEGGPRIVQSFDLALTLPPARLRAIAPIIVESERWPWPWPGDLVEDRLLLLETSRQTRITGLDVAQLDAARLGDVEVPVRFEVAAPESLAPGARSEATLEADRVFPVGMTTGTIEIRAPQLGESVIVPFEVRTKVYDLVIVVWFLGWGLLGWLLRHKLKDRVARAEILAALGPLRERARAEGQTHHDPEIQTSLGDLLRDLERQVQSARVPDIQTAAETLRKKLEEAELSSASYRAGITRKITGLERTLEARWELPCGVELASTLAAVRVARKQLVAGLAIQEQIRAMEDAFEPTRSTLTMWIQRTREVIDGLDPVPDSLPLPAEARDDLAAAVPAIKEIILSVPEFDPEDSLAGCGMLLSGAHKTHGKLLLLVRKIAAAFEREAGEAARLFAAAHPDGEDAAEISAAGRLTPLDPADPAASLERVIKEVGAFASMMKGHITNPLAQDELQQGRCTHAMKMQLASEGVMNDSVPLSFVAGEAATPESSVAAEAPELPPPGGTELLVMRPAPVEVVLADAMQELKVLQWTRGIASAGLLALITWVVYRASWTGTFDDFTGIAVFAFFSDFTLDAVFEAAAKLKKLQ